MLQAKEDSIQDLHIGRSMSAPPKKFWLPLICLKLLQLAPVL